ncbi:MAG: Clp protease ClpP [Bacteroidales bacterium]|nr:Clp protease ClpP [Bacteroidales bacterium]
MKVFNIIENPADVTVEIQGEIGGSWWGEGVTLDSVKRQLGNIAATKKNVIVKINSLGGDVDEALAIYELLVAMGDRVTTECYGRCASAATIIAMSGDKRKMSRYALFLIHKCWSGVVGNENVLEEVLEEQRAINGRLAAIYTDRTGSKLEDIEALMERNNGDGAWLTVEECMQYGFATEEITATTADSDYLKSKIQNMFHLNNRPMKKSIMTFAALAALLAIQELDATKEGAVLMDDETLKKINNALEAKQSEIDTLKQQKEAAETAKQQAEEAKRTAETAKAEAEAAKTKAEERAQELKSFIDKIPAAPTSVQGPDTKVENNDESWKNSETYKEACHELGVEE